MARKPVKAKPSLYAHYFEILKRIALTYGYNLVLHGSMDNDLDLILIPWEEKVDSYKKMIANFCKTLGSGHVQYWKDKPHGRIGCTIHFETTDFTGYDGKYYLDISIMPAIK